MERRLPGLEQQGGLGLYGSRLIKVRPEGLPRQILVLEGTAFSMSKDALDQAQINRFVEALLFVADGPVSLEELARALEVETVAVEQAIKAFNALAPQRGTCIIRLGDRVQMTTVDEASPFVERFLGISQGGKLSPAAMETLAIIAYRQPITRAQIEAIRGVNSEGVLRTLLARSLIAPMGRLEQAGRPILFGTTPEFLQYFGLRSLEELPEFPEALLSQDVEPTL